MPDPNTHAVSIEISASVERTFAFMTDPKAMDRWSFGTWKTVLHEGGLVEGSSIFDGSVTWVRIDGDKVRGTIDYHLGKDRDALDSAHHGEGPAGRARGRGVRNIGADDGRLAGEGDVG